MKTLILGGYGNFGARIARALARDAQVEVLIGGRDAGQAMALAAQLAPTARGIAIDARHDGFAQTLRSLGVQLLVHTAGPFQRQDYAVAQAAAEAGAHYIDLADGRRFVCDFKAHNDTTFRQADRCAISGASTVPALSSAVVDHLAAGWQRIDRIETCIAPAQSAPRGVATTAAVLSYCGEPIAVWREGRWQHQFGWANPQMVRFARLQPRLAAVCDIPDLELFPERYHGVRDVGFRAALEVRLAQLTLACLAALRRAGCIPRPSRWAAVLNAAAPVFDRFGTALGGMVVRVNGLDATGHHAVREWHIAADDNHGPEIPCMAAILLARKLARGEAMARGAHVCMGLLTLADFEPEFARWGMQIDVVGRSGPRWRIDDLNS